MAGIPNYSKKTKGGVAIARELAPKTLSKYVNTLSAVNNEQSAKNIYIFSLARNPMFKKEADEATRRYRKYTANQQNLAHVVITEADMMNMWSKIDLTCPCDGACSARCASALPAVCALPASSSAQQKLLTSQQNPLIQASRSQRI